MSDYARPARYQIIKHYRCKKCGDEQNVESCYSAAMPCPRCKGFVEKISESYPASKDDWDEHRIGDINSPFMNVRTGKLC